MKKLSFLLASAFLIPLCLPLTALAGQNIIYDGSDTGMLVTDFVWVGNNKALFPADSRSGNTVTVSDGIVDGYVYGGVATDASAVSRNNVIINGGTVKSSVFGGYSRSGNATGNTAAVSGGEVSESVYGGYSGSGNATGNTAAVSGGEVSESVYGGYSYSGNATGNTAAVSGGEVSESVYGGYSYSGNATGNTAAVSGGTVSMNVYGGRSDFGNATGNTAAVSGGTVSMNVYGGHSDSGNATGNTVILSGSPTFSSTDTTIYGGFGTGSKDYFSGNSLLVLNPISSQVKEVKNFQYYNFLLPAAPGGGAMLRATYIDLTATVNRLGVAPGSWLKPGDSYVLLDATAGSMTGTYTSNTVTATRGIALLYDLNVAKDGSNKLIATVTSGGRVNPQLKSLAEGRVSGLAFLNQGQDMVAGPVLDSISKATTANGSGGRKPANSLVGFSSFSGGSSRYNSGSHSDVNGFSLATGLGWRAPVENNALILGVFFEAGRGSYNSYNSFSNRDSVKGKGNSEYYGGGLAARHELTAGRLAGLYTEASLRAGHSSVDYYSDSLRDFLGRHASYDAGAVYYGAHVGVGYRLPLSEAASLDFSSKYLWTHQQGDSVTVLGDTIDFKATNSQRWRNGVRFAYTVETEAGVRLTPYIGAAYDYEFNGQAKSTTYGRTIEAPSLKGGTGVGELGLKFKPTANSPFALDLGAQGYTGVREGVAGTLLFSLEF